MEELRHVLASKGIVFDFFPDYSAFCDLVYNFFTSSKLQKLTKHVFSMHESLLYLFALEN